MATVKECQTLIDNVDMKELVGKTIRADLLTAYLFLEHEHCEEHGDRSGQPYVDSLPLAKFIRENAI